MTLVEQLAELISSEDPIISIFSGLFLITVFIFILSFFKKGR